MLALAVLPFTNLGPATVGKTLNGDLVVEGTVKQTGARLRVTVQLIDFLLMSRGRIQPVARDGSAQPAGERWRVRKRRNGEPDRRLDRTQTVATRKILLDRAATDRSLVYHYHFASAGTVSRQGNGFAWEPAETAAR